MGFGEIWEGPVSGFGDKPKSNLSEDGKYQIVVPNKDSVYWYYEPYSQGKRSSNYGESWDNFDTTKPRQAMSNDGRYRLGTLDGRLSHSSDYGNTWVYQDYYSANEQFKGLKISKNGQCIIAGTTFHLAISRDGGSTWDHQTHIDKYISGYTTGYGGVYPLANHFALSYTGQYQIMIRLASIESGGLFTYDVSSDYGETWTMTTLPLLQTWFSGTLKGWSSVAMSDSGQYIVVGRITSNDVNSLYYSNDYGVTWQVQGTLLISSTKVYISPTGQSQITLRGASHYLRSDDYGINWSTINTNFISPVSEIGLSDDFLIQSAIVDSNYAANYIERSIDGGVSWTNTGLQKKWADVVSSISGQYRIAYEANTGNTYLYISNDYGATWVQRGDSRHWFGIGISGDGGKMIACASPDYGPGKFYISTDYGITWIQDPLAGDVRQNYDELVISGDGRYQIAHALGVIYLLSFSSDYGATFTLKEGAIVTETRAIAISVNGQYILMAPASEYLYSARVSSDYGETWTEVIGESISFNKMSVAMSNTGQHMAVAFQDDYRAIEYWNGCIWISHDYGITWVKKNSSHGFYDISMSGTGQYLVAATNSVNSDFDSIPDYLLISIDYGETWATCALSLIFWASVVISNDSRYLLAFTSNGDMYKSFWEEIIDGIYLGRLREEQLLPAFGRTLTIADTELSKQERTASSRLTKEIIAEKMKFTLAYSLIDGEELEKILTAYEVQESVTRELSLLIREGGSEELHAVYMEPIDRTRVLFQENGLWSGINIVLNEI